MGPATAQDEIVERLLEAGMNVARFNFSHGNHQSHQEAMERVRRAAKKVGKPVHPEVFGWYFPLGSTGLYAYGDGRYLISQNFRAKTGQSGLLLPFVYDEKFGFLLDA